MSNMHLAQQYFDAWNAHDAAAIVATFAPGGTYEDPTTAGPLTRESIGQYAAGLWAAFPDLSFELVSAAPAGEHAVAAQWIMRGTNHGSMMGLPPTGKMVELPGADFVLIEAGGIRSVNGYFDSATLPRQLGLQTIVQPDQIGPFAFGTSTAAQNGNPSMPGALSFTSLVLRDPSEQEIVRGYSRTIATEMLQMPGFISFIGIQAGRRMMTISAWQDAEDSKQLMRGGTHKEAMRHLYNEDYYLGGTTSVWEPVRTSYLSRCGNCGKMQRLHASEGQCTCGAALSIPDKTW